MKIEKEVWVIMDKGHKAIACGTPRNRHLQLIDEDWSMRLITYNSKKKAEAGFKVSQFYLGNATKYMEETYGRIEYYDSYNYETKQYEKRGHMFVDQSTRYDEIYEAVKATLILEI